MKKLYHALYQQPVALVGFCPTLECKPVWNAVSAIYGLCEPPVVNMRFYEPLVQWRLQGKKAPMAEHLRRF
jgi:hypothetical protein